MLGGEGTFVVIDDWSARPSLLINLPNPNLAERDVAYFFW